MRAVLLGLVLVGFAPGTVFAQTMFSGRQYALVIGVNEYDDLHFPKLNYCEHDVERVYSVLTSRCGFAPENVVLMTAKNQRKADWPLHDFVQDKLEELIAQVKEGDTLFVFFSGHGVSLDNGEVVFATRDCRCNNPAGSGLTWSWLRPRLESCRATRKLLILDCCNAAAARASSARGSAEKVDLEPCFRDASGFIILASCRSDERSQEWAKVEQGLFTYYLCEGLQGAADSNNDRKVVLSELYDYVYNNVSRVASEELHVNQRPRVNPGQDYEGDLPLVYLDWKAAYPVLAKKGDVWVRTLTYTERYYILPSASSPASNGSREATYSETQQQRIKVINTDCVGRPTSLQIHFDRHEKTANGNLTGRPFVLHNPGPLQDKTIPLELTAAGARISPLDDTDSDGQKIPTIHPLELDELLLPETKLPTNQVTSENGRLKGFLDRILPQAKVQLSEWPTIKHTGDEVENVYHFEGKGQASACFPVHDTATFSFSWRVKYSDNEKRVRRTDLRAQSEPILCRGNQQLIVNLSCTIETGPISHDTSATRPVPPLKSPEGLLPRLFSRVPSRAHR